MHVSTEYNLTKVGHFTRKNIFINKIKIEVQYTGWPKKTFTPDFQPLVVL